MENLDPPSPQIKDGKMARFCPSRGFILDLGGWGFAVPFYFVQDCRKFSRLFHSHEMLLLVFWVFLQTELIDFPAPLFTSTSEISTLS